MPRKPLRVVSPDEKSERAKPLTVRQAADSTPRDMLVALRNTISSVIDRGVPAHALAPLSRQLMEIRKEIEAIDAEAEDGESSSVPDATFDPKAL